MDSFIYKSHYHILRVFQRHGLPRAWTNLLPFYLFFLLLFLFLTLVNISSCFFNCNWPTNSTTLVKSILSLFTPPNWVKGPQFKSIIKSLSEFFFEWKNDQKQGWRLWSKKNGVPIWRGKYRHSIASYI